MDSLPSELFQAFLAYEISGKELWRYRRVSKRWKVESEQAYASHLFRLYSSSASLLHLDLFLLNAHGNPYFSYFSSTTNAIPSSPSHTHLNDPMEVFEDPLEPPRILSSPTSPIEDSARIPLYIHSIDPVTKTLELLPAVKSTLGSRQSFRHAPNNTSASTATLKRRSGLSRFEWCVKGLLRSWLRPEDGQQNDASLPTGRSLGSYSGPTAGGSSPLSSSPSLRRAPSAFTLVSVDTDLASPMPGPNLSKEMSVYTYEVQLVYSVKGRDGLPPPLVAADEDTDSDQEDGPDIQQFGASSRHSYLEVNILKFKASYSFVFQHLYFKDESAQLSLPPRISVFEAARVESLTRAAESAGLEWREKYWSFDLVLHWLGNGDVTDVPSLIEFLLEHERHQDHLAAERNKKTTRSRKINDGTESLTQQARRSRYYNSTFQP